MTAFSPARHVGHVALQAVPRRMSSDAPSQAPLEANAPTRAPIRTRWDIILVAFGAGMVAAGHIGKLPAALPEIRAELALNLVAAGWIVSIFNAVTILLGMLVGVFADRL